MIAAGCGSGGGEAAPAPAALAPAASSAAPAFAGSGSGPFCAEVRGLADRFATLLSSGDPGATRALYSAAQQAVNAMADAAPPEIKGELTVLVDAYRQLLDGLRTADYDVTRLPREVTGALASPSVRSAAGRLETYARTVCGAGG